MPATPSDPPAAPARLRRLEFLDAARGIAVIAMLAANLVNVFIHRTPGLLRHNEGDLLRPFDFPAPTFQFLVGVSLALFLRARRAAGRTAPEARRDAFRRFALLVLLGMALDVVGSLGFRVRWGVLQTLGLGGAAATLVSDLPVAPIVALALVLLGMYSGVWNGEVHGDPISALAFVPLTLGGLLVGRRIVGTTPRRNALVASACVGCASALLAAAFYGAGIPFSKIEGTSSFVALSTAAASALVAATAAFEAANGRLPRWIVEVGRNALLAWVLQYVLVFYPAWIFFPGWRRLPLFAGIAVVCATVTLLSALSVALGRRGVRIPI